MGMEFYNIYEKMVKKQSLTYGSWMMEQYP
jgi:hypothetical protein